MIRRVPPWVWLTLLVLVTAVSAMKPLHEPRLPGTLRVGVLGGEDPAALDRALGPFADYLGEGLRRSATLRVVDARALRDGRSADLLLLPSALVGERGADVLAWAKPVGRSGLGSAIVLVRRAGVVDGVHRVALGDSTLFGGQAAAATALRRLGIEVQAWTTGRSVYRHDEALVLLEHGVVDAAVVLRPALEAARARGELPAPEWNAQELAPPRPHMALVATASLSEPARRIVRERALNLDHFRYDPQNAPAGVVLQGLAQLGIGGFAPTGPFPSLRP